ncbi:hypothetical protein XM47_15440 [Catenovulum maritimum]|uniref:Uncharacterized protein n=1 Tax=Catenovulum maritimum TaxID=1513271 RepID=A0A0J8GN87_9ALTE|nr:hypothetical protein XM47_15440 [Catenovulum maritimum]
MFKYGLNWIKNTFIDLVFLLIMFSIIYFAFKSMNQELQEEVNQAVHTLERIKIKWVMIKE